MGHLDLTTGGLAFRGTVDLRIFWGDVARIEGSDTLLTVALHGAHRLLCFRCQTDVVAARGRVVADHLATLAQAPPIESV